MTDGLKTIAEAAEWLNISPKTLSEWAAAGLVPFTTLASRTADGRPSTRLIRFAARHLEAIVAMGERLPIEAHAALLPRATHPPAGPMTPTPPAGPREGTKPARKERAA